MIQYAKGPATYECGFDEQCSAVFASLDDLERHEREDHWALAQDDENEEN
jgi:hypothetical protein